MDQIEFDDPEHSTCDCCGKKTTRLTRFVRRDGNAFAVYFVMFTDGHEDSAASVMVGIGDWDDDAVPEDARVAFTYRIWLADDSYQLSVIDPDDSPWDTEYLGRRLPRDEALHHDLLQEVFDLSDHMVRCDQPLIEHLNARVA